MSSRVLVHPFLPGTRDCSRIGLDRKNETNRPDQIYKRSNGVVLQEEMVLERVEIT